jgi:hypothetical protein
VKYRGYYGFSIKSRIYTEENQGSSIKLQGSSMEKDINRGKSGVRIEKENKQRKI